jgi:imidazolonepropionase-like amidohydrolase
VLLPVVLIVLAGSATAPAQRQAQSGRIREVNVVAPPDSKGIVAIVGALLIDGRGGEPVRDATVVVNGGRIAAVGARSKLPVPAGAEILEAGGLTVLPGLLDAHFHLDGNNELPALFLSHGVTSVRDPGAWIEAYEAVRAAKASVPRLFLTGPHMDTPPPAYPQDSLLVRDADETRVAVTNSIDTGASAIKVYFRLPLGLIKVVTETAHARGIPVTSHLEIVDAAEAIRAGVDGIEHVTSLGTALLPRREAEKYRQAVIADNRARNEGRYAVWSNLDLESPRVRPLLDLMLERGTFLSPTLAVFERRSGDKDVTEVHVRGFEKMLAFVGRARRAGVKVVLGSHSSVPHAERGWAYQREMELLVEGGMKPMEALVAATSENARFFRVTDRLGTVETGKLADLVLIEGDPLQDIRLMRRVKRVMLNGKWIN